MPEVVICGSDPVALRSLEALVRAEGFKCSTFSHLSETLQRCQRGQCKLAIVSLDYPARVESGGRLEPVRVIRQICPDLPVVVVSDPEELEEERQLRSLGIFYLQTTPVSARELSDVVRCAIRKRNSGVS